MSAESGQMLSHYRLVEKIGEGGMGVVWKAEDTVLNRTVAIKVLPADLTLDEDRRRMFLEEARLAASVSHGNIVQVHELGRERDLDFIVMEYVAGQPLRRMLHGQPLPPDKVAEWGLQVAQGLARAHRKGLIHRDLKPANILVTPEGELKIVDFGLATLFAPPDSTSPSSASTAAEGLPGETTPIAGTVPYMSPEQVRGDKLDARSDIFSFGTVLYEMTTGRRPFTGAHAADIAREIQRSQPRPVHEVVPKVPFDLHRIVEKALARRPEERYQDMDDLVVDLRRLARDLDSGSSPSLEDLQRQARNGMRSRRWLSSVAAILLVAVVTTVTAGLRRGWFGSHAPKAPREVKLRQLTQNAAENWVENAALSPDGKFLAFGDKTGLFVRAIETGEVKQLSSEEFSVVLLAWFPDGMSLLATTDRGTYVIHILSGSTNKLLDTDGGCVSPDGSQIAFCKNPSEIWLMGADGENPHRIVNVGAKRQVGLPVWLPDGKRIAFVKFPVGSDSLPAIENVDTQGRDGMTVLSDKGLQYKYGTSAQLACTSDWRLFYYLNQDSLLARATLWQLALERGTGKPKGDPHKITEIEGYFAAALSASQDGRRLVFLKKLGQHDVYFGPIAADGSLASPRRLTLDNASDRPVGWTSDSRRVLFTSTRTGTHRVFIQDIESVTPEVLPLEGADCLSPDGASVLSCSRGSLFRFRLPSGPTETWVEKLPEGADVVRCPWSSPACVLGPVQRVWKDRVTFWSLETDGGKMNELITIDVVPGRSNWAVSPDGTRIAVVETNGRIRVLAILHGEVREIPVEQKGFFQSVAWSAGGEALFVTVVPSGPWKYALLRFDLQGHVRVLHEGPQWCFDPRPSRDGHYLAFGLMNFDYNAWLIEGL